MENFDMNGLIREYLCYCELQKGLSTCTLKAYRIDLLQFSSFFATLRKIPDKEDLMTYLAFLHTKYQMKTVKRKIASIKAFMNYMEEEKLLDSNPFSKMRIKLHEPFLLPRTIPLLTIETLLQCIYGQAEHNTATAVLHKN